MTDKKYYTLRLNLSKKHGEVEARVCEWIESIQSIRNTGHAQRKLIHDQIVAKLYKAIVQDEVTHSNHLTGDSSFNSKDNSPDSPTNSVLDTAISSQPATAQEVGSVRTTAPIWSGLIDIESDHVLKGLGAKPRLFDSDTTSHSDSRGNPDLTDLSNVKEGGAPNGREMVEKTAVSQDAKRKIAAIRF